MKTALIIILAILILLVIAIFFNVYQLVQNKNTRTLVYVESPNSNNSTIILIEVPTIELNPDTRYEVKFKWDDVEWSEKGNKVKGTIEVVK